jgi:hypothetical protein
MDLKECTDCGEIICEPCKNKIRGQICPSCDSELHLRPLSNMKLKKILNSLKESHCCDPGAKNRTETPIQDVHQSLDTSSETTTCTQRLSSHTFTLPELKNHLEICPKNRTCKDCFAVFDSVEDYKSHLQFDCIHVKIQCHDCHKEYTRYRFRLPDHKCYFYQRPN